MAIGYLGECIGDERAYCYVRFECGDEMSKRAKFAFITWIGQSVPPLKKAKVSTDKAFVKLAMPVSVLHKLISLALIVRHSCSNSVKKFLQTKKGKSKKIRYRKYWNKPAEQLMALENRGLHSAN